MKVNTSLVILCGGKGTKLGNITKKIPKPLIRINKKPFIEYLINFYQRYNFDKIYLIGHYKAQQFKKLYKDKEFNFIKCEFIKEKKPLDTAGALNSIKNKVKGDMVVINGECYLNYDFIKFDNFNNSHKSHSMILVRNQDYKSNNKLNKLKIEEKFIKESNQSKLMNSGVYFFKKNIFNLIPRNKKISLENNVLPNLIKKKKIKGIYSDDYFINIGSKNNLNFAKKKLINIIKKPAIYLDRDGVINEDTGYPHIFEKMKWIEHTLNFLRKIKKNKINLFVVTNQSGIARGLYDEKKFSRLQKKIKRFLIKKEIFLDDVRYCPHHPNQGIKKYKINCKCRKPKNKMFKDLISYWNIDLKKSLMIGDSSSDFLAANKSKLKFFYQSNENYSLIQKKFRFIFD